MLIEDNFLRNLPTLTAKTTWCELPELPAHGENALNNRKQDEPARKVVSGQLILPDITKNTLLSEL